MKQTKARLSLSFLRRGLASTLVCNLVLASLVLQAPLLSYAESGPDADIPDIDAALAEEGAASNEGPAPASEAPPAGDEESLADLEKVMDEEDKGAAQPTERAAASDVPADMELKDGAAP